MRLRALCAACAAAALCACASAPAPADPLSAEARAYGDFLVGRFANLRDDHQTAADRYFDALRDEPGTPELIEGAVDATLAAGDVRRARLGARLAQDSGVDLAAARLVRAADALAQNRWSAASAETRGLDGDGVQELTGRILAIWAEAGAGNTDVALANLGLIEMPPPFSGIFHYQRAMTLELAGRDDEAAGAYAQARTAGLWLPPAAVRDVDMLARLNRGEESARLYRDASGRIRDPDLQRTIEAAQTNGRVAHARLTPARGAAIGVYAIGALLSEQREYSRATALLTLALMLDSGLDAARVAFADAEREAGRYAGARAALAQIPPASPYAENARVTAAWILNEEERTGEAIAAAQAAAQSGSRIARIALADLYRGADRWGEADAAYTALIDSIETPSAGDWTLFFARGAARERLDRWPEAEADFRRALELAPDQPETLNYLGYAMVDRGQNLEEGLALVQRAASLRPNSGHIIDSLGWAYYRLGDYERAVELLERAVELEPADVTLNDHLGDALWRAGRRVEARYQWSRALTLDPTAAERAPIERKLAEGLPADPAESTAAR
ncbi:MAG: tetratricopeptide repeat protein [Hyphomonadaceae bacterium]